MPTARELLERALQAFRTADEMTCPADAREMRHIADEYLNLAAEATERMERAAKSPVAAEHRDPFDTVAGSA